MNTKNIRFNFLSTKEIILFTIGLAFLIISLYSITHRNELSIEIDVFFIEPSYMYLSIFLSFLIGFIVFFSVLIKSIRTFSNKKSYVNIYKLRELDSKQEKQLVSNLISIQEETILNYKKGQVMTNPSFDISIIERISKILGHTDFGFKGHEITDLFKESNIDDVIPNATKWKRIKEALASKQLNDGCANNVLNFIKISMKPSRHIGNSEWYHQTLREINKTLLFEGYEILEDGNIKIVKKAQTISEAQKRANNLKENLKSRNIHLDVIKYCKEELLRDNYFHAVFEATKSLADKIRAKTGLITDGADLIDDAFKMSDGIPHLALNSLETKSQRSEQTGFINLLKGIFGMFRNTLAHEPKISFEMKEEDAIDILTVISLMHRKIDSSIEARRINNGFYRK